MNDPSVFAVLAEGRRTWAVASIYADVERLIRLHDALAARVCLEDNVVYLGNLLGRGQVADTVHELLLFRRALMASRLGDGAGDIASGESGEGVMW